ncbi:hypothetical protein BGZ73_008995 [Actinomortierella ambigua]|nr:hypothetical protein BGZ73_008995 [Actinomortierella ambigua]
MALLSKPISILGLKPKSLVWIILSIGLAKFLREVIYNIFFHPLRKLPSNPLLCSTYIPTALGVLSGMRRYGKIVRVAPNIVSVADKDLIHEILVTMDYPKSELHRNLRLTNQETIFSTTRKDFHRSRRRLIAPAFGLQYLRSLEPIMQESVQVLIHKIDSILEDPASAKSGRLPQGQVDVCSLMDRLGFDVIGATAFNESFRMIENDSHPAIGKLTKSLKRSMQQVFNPWMRYLIPIDRSFIEFAGARIEHRRKLGEEGRRADLLQYLLDAQAREIESGNGPSGHVDEDRENGKLTDIAVQFEALVFLIAGSDTSSTTMTFIIMFLVQHPDKLKKLQEELDVATACNPPGALPSYDQVRNLPYLAACINEAMRLRPIAATGIPREVDEDREMLGFKIPKGTVVLAQFSQLHWSNEYFPEADKYIPERWIPEESPFPPVQDFTFYPFSAGTRNCVGKNFAMMEMKYCQVLSLATALAVVGPVDVLTESLHMFELIEVASD